MKKRKTKPPAYYPAFLNLAGKKCVVIGGGKVALRKIRMLLESHAKIVVISPSFHPALLRLSKRVPLRLIQRKYRSGDLRGAILTFSATGDAEINQQVAAHAKKARIPVNVSDDPGRSDFIVPSLLRKGGLTIAVSTAGMSPALARKIRTELEEAFGDEYESLLGMVGEVRSELREKKVSVSAEAWQQALDLDLLTNFVRRRQRKKARTFLLSRLAGVKKPAGEIKAQREPRSAKK